MILLFLMCILQMRVNVLIQSTTTMKRQSNSSVLKNLLGDPNGKLGREDLFILTVGNEAVHGGNNDSSVRTVNFASSRN